MKYMLLLLIFSVIVFSFVKSRRSRNIHCINEWLRNFDIISFNERYRGERSTIQYEFYIEKLSFGSYGIKRLYKTISGRYFEIEVISDFSDVVKWNLTRIDQEDGDAFLSSVGSNLD